MGNMCASEPAEECPNTKNIKRVRRSSKALSSDDPLARQTCPALGIEKSIENGDFQVVSQLGSGAQADIFQIRLSTRNSRLSTHTIQSPTYALKKIYKNNYLNNKQSLQLGGRILMEHKNPFIIAGVHRYEDDDYIYQVMEKAEGTLTSYLHGDGGCRFRKMGEWPVKFVAAGVVIGLQALRERGVIYCDLKPDNILIDAQGYPLLSDFQMSQQGPSTTSRGYRGTLRYTAPQLHTQKTIDHSMDLWALGICLYSMVTGTLPYDSEQIYSPSFMGTCIYNEGRYQFGCRGVSGELRELVLGLLRTNPKARLGYFNMAQIKQHVFFKDFDWNSYTNRTIPSPLLSIPLPKPTSCAQSPPGSPLSPPAYKQKPTRKTSADRETACDDIPTWNSMGFGDI